MHAWSQPPYLPVPNAFLTCLTYTLPSAWACNSMGVSGGPETVGGAPYLATLAACPDYTARGPSLRAVRQDAGVAVCRRPELSRLSLRRAARALPRGTTLYARRSAAFRLHGPTRHGYALFRCNCATRCTPLLRALGSFAAHATRCASAAFTAQAVFAQRHGSFRSAVCLFTAYRAPCGTPARTVTNA